MKVSLFLFFATCIFTGLFSQQFDIKPIEGDFGFSRGIEVADLDNDGNLDVVTLRTMPTPEIACWFGDGSGGFGTKVIIQQTPDETNRNGGDDLTVLDVDNDGFLDIVAVPEYRLDESNEFSLTNSLAWYPNNGNRAFGPLNVIERLAGNESNRILVLDVDNNGFDDVVVGDINFGRRRLASWKNNGDASFETEIPLADIGDVTVRYLEKAFVNRDAFLDLIYVGSSSSINLLVNNQDGTFQEPRVILDDLSEFRPNFLSVGDVNGDGNTDLLVSSFNNLIGELLVWFEGNGEGDFADYKVIATNENDLFGGSESALADLDGDGDQDAVLVTFTDDGNFLQWWKNDGNGNFGDRIVINDTFNSGYGLEIADINNDGKQDIVATNGSGIYWFENINLDEDNDGVLDSNDACPNTPEGSTVDENGCTVFSLPIDNFVIKAFSETCRSSNNGRIEILAKENYNYTIILNGESETAETFTNEVEFENLEAGGYEVCVTVENQPDYEQCFTVSVTEPEDLSISSKINSILKKVNLTLLGASRYTIVFNGKEFTTTNNEVSLDLIGGENTLKVKTEKNCQGIYEETFFLADKIAYPNPVKDKLFISLLENNDFKTEVSIYNLNNKILFVESYSTTNNRIELDMSSFAKGVYFIQVVNGQSKHHYKVIK